MDPPEHPLSFLANQDPVPRGREGGPPGMGEGYTSLIPMPDIHVYDQGWVRQR